MSSKHIFLVLIMCSAAAVRSVNGRTGTMDDLIRLNNTLFSNYTKEIYPVYNLSNTMTVYTSLLMLSILDFDEVAGVITINGGLILTWNDFRLTWNPADFGGITDILINSTLAWTPKVFLTNTAEDMEPFETKDFSLRILYNGECLVSPGKVMKSTCSVDMSDFPLDAHTCDILLSQWSVMADEAIMGISRSHFVMDFYAEHGEWEVTETSVAVITAYNQILYKLGIKRRPMYFSLSLIIPILLLCFLNPFVFLLPASSGERISYTITMFLSLAVYMSIIGDSLPRVSENMARMSIFLLVTLIYSTCLILLTILTLRYEAITHVDEFPKFIRKLTFCFLGKKKNKVLNGRLNFVVEKEKNNEVENPSFDVGKDDVMRLINYFLFFTSQLCTIILITWFFCSIFA
ncbi:neuronal acetylcholine receptor subunit alpha-6-like [Argopecten irradians]|uniref:neuronal acetylcholine receptor subunit alpha-6-like n=1 Tax=Argopecten irradians TaxID=31199 RepID=UPI003721CFAB